MKYSCTHCRQPKTDWPYYQGPNGIWCSNACYTADIPDEYPKPGLAVVQPSPPPYHYGNHIKRR